MELKCVFSIDPKDLYTCIVKSASITEPNMTIKSVQGTHMEGKNNAHVKNICFDEGNTEKPG